METNPLRQNLVCILFPGVVKNEDKALDCLGGVQTISEIYSRSNKERLGLSFQPQNPFVKKVFADISKTAGLVIKVKVKKTVTGDIVKREVMSSSVVGTVKQSFQFNSLCDFQYLPVSTETNPPTCIAKQYLPTSFANAEEFLNTTVPGLITPTSFTRTDKPLGYAYTDKKDDNQISPSAGFNEEDNIHYRTREDRKGPTSQFKFNIDDEIPSGPDPQMLDQLEKVGSAIYPEYEIVKKLFEDRPIWSKNAIKYETKIKHSSLRIILPCIGLNYKNGPWKLLWVRYGYDPRKDPGARMYQCLDFRLRRDGALCSLVKTRESINHSKMLNHVRRSGKNSNDTSIVDELIPEDVVHFRPGMIPGQRQIYYQYCDVHIPEVEALLSIPPALGTLCHPHRGWLEPGVDSLCRDQVCHYTKQALLNSNNPNIKFETSTSSEEERNSEDEGSNCE